VSENEAGVLRITLVRSTIGRPADQGRTVASLGLRRLNATVERPDNPSIRGMVTKIRHLVKVEELPTASGAPESSKSEKNERKAASSV
jgi:large subunit ribosomal protein L30